MATRKSTPKVVHLPLFPEASYEKKLFSRVCPSCGATILHTLKGNRNKAEKKKMICRECDNARKSIAYSGEGNPFYGRKHDEETVANFRARTHPHVKTEWFRELRSAQMTGSRNPVSGTSNYEIWVSKFGKERADELMDSWRRKASKASSGKGNPMYGKATPQGSGNGWSGWYKGWFFKSLRELSYMVNVIEKEGLQWRTAETAELKIPYAGFGETQRTYIADFLIAEKILVEIKPRKLHKSPTVLLKQAAAVEFCKGKGLEYQLVDHPPLSDSEVVELHDSGRIKFTDRYEAKFNQRFNR